MKSKIVSIYLKFLEGSIDDHSSTYMEGDHKPFHTMMERLALGTDILGATDIQNYFSNCDRLWAGNVKSSEYI